jgi:hypothetical protein
MAWFSRKAPVTHEPDANVRESGADVDMAGGPPEPPLRPVIEPPGVEEQERIARGRAALDGAGVDVDDLPALGAAFDAALTTWQNARKSRREDERDIVERFAIGIGEHLHRHTDLNWSRATDAFGTDLAVAGGRDDFVVVPTNLVSARWMNAEKGWLPGVVGHLVRVRASRSGPG